MKAYEAAAWIETRIKELAVQKKGGSRVRPEVKFYASGLGDVLGIRDEDGPVSCTRKAYLAFFPEQAPQLPMTAEALLNMLVGDAYHEAIAALLDQGGTLVRSEYALRSDHISGRMDWLVQIPKFGLVVLDGKSMADYAFDKATSPKAEHVAQVNYYAGEMGLEWWGLVYFKKSTGDLRVFVERFDRELFNITKERAGQLALLVETDRTSGKLDNIPPIPEGMRASKFPCSWKSGSCSFYQFCHGELPPHMRKDEVPTLRLKVRGGGA